MVLDQGDHVSILRSPYHLNPHEGPEREVEWFVQRLLDHPGRFLFRVFMMGKIADSQNILNIGEPVDLLIDVLFLLRKKGS